jgi:UDP-N-acetylglucosamine 2-epimerase (non-hydrolysing)
MGIPIYHLEAGNRSFDSNVPEEINRRIVDHIADFNFPYSELARANLISEGIHPRKIYLMGSPLPEVFNSHLPRILKSKILEELNLEPRNYFLVSAHRQENVDSKDRLATLLSALERMIEEFNIPIMVSTHPRTKIKLANLNKTYSKKIIFHKPFGFLDYNKLQMNARVVLSDSGTISEESVILGFPAVTIRDSMERPEALEAGSIIMCGLNEDRVIEAIRIVENNQRSKVPPKEYEIPDTSTRIANVLVSTVHQHAFWNGIRKYEK